MVEHAGNNFSGCQKRSLRTDTCGWIAWKRNHMKNSFHWARKCLQHRCQQVCRLALSDKQQCRFCFGAAEGVFRARAVRRLEQNDRWDKEMIEGQVRVPWGRTDGRWAVVRIEVRVDPVPTPMSFDGLRVQRDRITKQDIEAHGATLGCPGCM